MRLRIVRIKTSQTTAIELTCSTGEGSRGGGEGFGCRGLAMTFQENEK